MAEGENDVDRVAQCRKILARGGTLEDVLWFLRNKGLSKLDCVVTLEDEFRFPHHEAKEIVHHSKTMSDVLGSDEALHARLEELLGEDE